MITSTDWFSPMCRLLGVVSSEPAVLPRLVGPDLHEFSRLSSVHCDGWGLAYWDGEGSLSIEREPRTALSSERFASAVAGARTDAAVLHLRKASVGMANVAANTHPFASGSVALAHNGYVSPRPVLDAMLAEAGGDACAGETDTERFFRLVLAAMRRHDPVPALVATADAIAARARLLSLNCLLLTETALYAYARYDEAVIAAEGEDVESYRLQFRAEPGRVVVASNGWDQPSPFWEPVANGQILEVRRGTLWTSLHRLNHDPGPVPA